MKIRVWNKKFFGNIFEQKRKLEKKMEIIQMREISGERS
jgi:hypothetical protein